MSAARESLNRVGRLIITGTGIARIDSDRSGVCGLDGIEGCAGINQPSVCRSSVTRPGVDFYIRRHIGRSIDQLDVRLCLGRAVSCGIAVDFARRIGCYIADYVESVLIETGQIAAADCRKNSPDDENANGSMSDRLHQNVTTKPLGAT